MRNKNKASNLKSVELEGGLINKNIRQRYGYKEIAKFFEINDIVIPKNKPPIITKKNYLSLPKITIPTLSLSKFSAIPLDPSLNSTISPA